MTVATGVQECLGKQPSDPRPPLAVKVVGENGHEAVVKRGYEQLTDANSLKSRCLQRVEAPLLSRFMSFTEQELDVCHGEEHSIGYICNNLGVKHEAIVVNSSIRRAAM